jgi:hypothetical protein
MMLDTGFKNSIFHLKAQILLLETFIVSFFLEVTNSLH